MNEKEFINKIKKLKEIKAQREWVILCKDQILGKEKPNVFLLAFQNLFQVKLLKPVYAVSITVIILTIGIVSFFNIIDREGLIEVVETPAEIKPETTQEIILTLEDLQLEIDNATESLKEIKEPQKVLKARDAVVPFITNTREIISQVEKEIEKLELKENDQNKNRILATIININESLNNIQNIQHSTEITIIKKLIEDFETKTFLTEDQQELLTKAREAYINKNYEEALRNIILIQEMIGR